MSGRKKCICQICTCGRHVCMHRRKDTQLLLGKDSSYESKERSLEAKRKRSQQENQWNLTNGEVQAVSAEVDQINAQQVLANAERQEIALTVHDKGNTQVNVNGTGNTWSSKQVPKTLLIRPADNLKPGGEADFTTLHQLSYAQTTAAETQRGSWNSKQIPKTLPIKIPDSLKLTGPLILETTNQKDFNENVFQSKAAEAAQGEKSPRPRTSLKLSGEFHSDSSYQQAFTPKHQVTNVVKKGPTVSHLKPEGDMTFDTTSLDYRAALVEKSKLESEHSKNIPLKPTPAKPQSGIKIPAVPLEDETTAVTDYKRWNVEKPERYRPADTLQLDDGTTETEDYISFERKSRTGAHSKEKDLEWQVSRPAAGKTQNNVQPEGNFENGNDIDHASRRSRYSQSNLETVTERSERPADTLQLGDGITETEDYISFARKSRTGGHTKEKDLEWEVSRPAAGKTQNNVQAEGNFENENDIDHASRRSRYSQSNLETVTERSEREVAEAEQSAVRDTKEVENFSEGKNQESDTSKLQKSNTAVQKESETASVTEIRKETDFQNQISQTRDDGIEHATVLQSNKLDETHAGDTEYASQNGEQMEYVTWDQIRPKAIRPQSNLKQEGGMEFNTTNRSEFIQRPTERVKGIRPKTTTKVFEGDFDATTMNQIMFTHDQVERVNPIRPKSNLHLEDGQFVDETTTAREYQQWEVKRPSPIVHKSSLMQQGTIDFTTTNRTEFEEKRPEKVHPIRPTTTNRISGELDLKTTNQIMHGPFPIEKVQKIVPQPNLRTNSGAFNSETTNKAQFQEYHIDRPKPIRPISNLRQEGSMDFTTMNQLQFEEKPMEKVSQFRPQTSSKITGDFDGVTTNRMMYTSQPTERTQMIKPKGNIELEKGTFEHDTTKQLDFQQWQADKPQAITPRNNLHQEGNMDFTTTNQLQYVGKTSERVSQIRPKTNPKISGEFDGTTTNRLMYQNVTGEKSKAIRPKTNLHVEKGNFAGETTNNREFQNWGYEKPTPIKPQSSLRQEGTTDYTTTNSMQFEPKTSERPAQIRPTTSTKITGDFDGTTTNQIMYQNNPLETVRGVRPSTHIHLEDGKFEDQTTSQREYQTWELAKAEPIKHSGTLVQEGTMDFTTSNRTDYGMKPITKTEAIRPLTSSQITGEFDSTTTNQIMYQAQAVDRVHGIKPKDNLQIQNGEFSEETTTSREYGYKAESKAEPIKPKPNLSQEGNIDFVTSNQLAYDGKSAEKVSQNRPKTHTKVADGKFHGETTNQVMFQAPVMETVHAVRPSTNLKTNEGGIQNTTTMADAYQQWKTERPKAFQLTSSLKQEGEMNFETTNSSDFRGKSFERVQQIRPKTSSKIEGDFVGTTTNQAMFHQPENIERVKPIRQQNNLHLEHGRFSEETTTNREYKQWVKMGGQIAVPKKKLQAAGISTQRERPNRRKEISKTQEKDTNFNPKEAESGRTKAAAQVDTSDSTIEINSKEVEKVATNADSGPVHNIQQSSSETKATDKSMEQQTNLRESTQGNQTSKDISTVKSEYGGRQAAIDESLIQKEDAAATSKTHDDQQTTSYIGQKHAGNTQELITNGIKGKENYDSWKLAQNETTSTLKMANETGVMSRERNIPEKKQQSNQNLKSTKHYRPPDNLKIEHVPFDGTSTSQIEYKKWEARRSSIKKRSENLKQEGEMQFDTTSNDYSVLKDYQMNREGRRPRIKEELKKGSLTPTGSMEFSTTSKSSYVGLSNVARPKNLRPRSSLRLGVADTSSQEMLSSSRSNPEISSTRENYDLTSTSRASYVGYTGTRSRANRPSTSQKVGEGAFDGQSTTQSSFTMPQETTVVKSKSIKPESHNIFQRENGLTGDTTYRSSFETKKGHCPVLDLEAGKLPLTFKEERNGHVFYAPRVQG